MVQKMFLLFLKHSVVRSERSVHLSWEICAFKTTDMSETQAVEEILVDEPMPTPDMFSMPYHPIIWLLYGLGMAMPPFIILLRVPFCFITSQTWGNIQLEVDEGPTSIPTSVVGQEALLGDHSCFLPWPCPWSPYSLPSAQLDRFFVCGMTTFHHMICVLHGLALNGLPQFPVARDHLSEFCMISLSSIFLIWGCVLTCLCSLHRKADTHWNLKP